GIRDRNVTGVQTCALPILSLSQQTEWIAKLIQTITEKLLLERKSPINKIHHPTHLAQSRLVQHLKKKKHHQAIVSTSILQQKTKDRKSVVSEKNVQKMSLIYDLLIM